MSTKIEWTDETWSPVTGCTQISEGCKNCYAKRMSKRLAGRCGYPKDEPFLVTTHSSRLFKPFHWKKPKRIFVCSMGDLFHKSVENEFIAAVFGVMAANPQHIFLILTKRPDRMLEWFRIIQKQEDGPSLECAFQAWNDEAINHPEGFSGPIHRHGPAPDAPWPLPNVHIGVTAENQSRADERIPVLLQIPAAKRFVSCEPLLGPINFDSNLGGTRWIGGQRGCGATHSHSTGHDGCRQPHHHHDDRCNHGLNQVIVGAETGPGKRAMELDWARSLRDQCQITNTPFFFKKDSTGDHKLYGEIWEELTQ